MASAMACSRVPRRMKPGKTQTCWRSSSDRRRSTSVARAGAARGIVRIGDGIGRQVDDLFRAQATLPDHGVFHVLAAADWPSGTSNGDRFTILWDDQHAICAIAVASHNSQE